jgi:mRNA interferase RelE/StbE
MPFSITITEDAERQHRSLEARVQRIVEDAVFAKLTNDPTTATRSIKRLRPNPFAEFELRVGSWRVLYNVEDVTVVVLLVGRKAGNKLIVEGVEFHGHQDYPPEQSGGGPAKNGQ